MDSRLSRYGLGGVGASKSKAVVGLERPSRQCRYRQKFSPWPAVKANPPARGTSLIGSAADQVQPRRGLIDMTSTQLRGYRPGRSCQLRQSRQLATELNAQCVAVFPTQP